MTTPTQPKPNPVPAILVYGTPSGPALTQASWFRAEDKEAVKAAAEALKFSVIELQTDAERALAAGAHEGVLKGSGRMIVGSVSAEVYRRIEEHVRKGAGAPDPSKPEIAAATTTKPASEQNTNIGAAGAISPGPSRATSAAPAIDKPDSATARETLRVGARVLAAYWNEKREFEGFWLATVKRIEHGEFTLEWFDARNIRRSRAGPRTSPFRIPSSASRASDARTASSQTPWGGLRVAPLHFAHAHEPGARHPNPQPQETKAMTSTTVSTAERIRALNDAFRRTFVGGVVMITAGVEAMPLDQRRSLLAKVRAFDAFTDDNDPHGEHDFGAVDEGGVRCFWKIDYYDRNTEFGSPDPADPAVTTRVLTIMRADEY